MSSEVRKAHDMMSTMDRAVRAADTRKQLIAVNYRTLESELSETQERSDIMRRDFEVKIAQACNVNEGLQAHVHKLQAANIELTGRLKVLTSTLKRNSRFAQQCDDAAGMVDQIRAGTLPTDSHALTSFALKSPRPNASHVCRRRSTHSGG